MRKIVNVSTATKLANNVTFAESKFISTQARCLTSFAKEYHHDPLNNGNQRISILR